MFSTETQARNNFASIIEDDIDPAVINDRIEQADNQVKIDLASIIDFSLVPDTTPPSSNLPDFINKLSQYKTMELLYVKLFGAKRLVQEQSDRIYWQKMYSNPDPAIGETEGLLERVKSFEIPLELVDGTSISGTTSNFSNIARDGVEPAFGVDKYGEFLTDDELLEDRPVEDD